MTGLYVWMLIGGTLVLLLGLFAGWFQERWFLTEPLLAVILGVIIGPACFGLLHLEEWGNKSLILEEVARVTLAVADMGVALRLSSGYAIRHWRPLALILGVGMPLMWLASGALVWGVLGLPFWVAMLVGATVTSTDPVVATTIVTGKIAEKNVPERIRQFISAESGANDGMVYPLVLLPVLILMRPTGDALSHWLMNVVMWQVVGAIIMGAVLGYSASWLHQWSEKTKIVEEGAFLAYTVALTFVVLGATRLLGMDGVLAVFVAGLAFRMAPGAERAAEEQKIQQAMTKFFVLPSFVLVGLALPWASWYEIGWRGVALAVLVLLLRRPPIVWGLSKWLRPLRTRKDIYFTGWFGPIGISTLFYAMIVQRQTGLDQIWEVASLLLCASLLAHGFTATPSSRRMS